MNHNVKDQMALPPVSSCPSAILSPTAASTISKMQKVCYALFCFFYRRAMGGHLYLSSLVCCTRDSSCHPKHQRNDWQVQ